MWPIMVVTQAPRKRYTFWKFVGDALMTCFTGGLWLIWCFFRYIGNR